MFLALEYAIMYMPSHKAGQKGHEMARTSRLKKNAPGTAYYHLMSRANDRNPVRAGLVKHAADYPWCWIAPSDGPSAGSVPGWAVVEARLMRRVLQIGDGKIFGSRGFVFDAVIALGDRFQSRSVTAREVDGIGFATHGWRLARMAVAKGAA